MLQQLAGAELVGERTFGHAGRQVLVELSSGGRVFLTDAFYAGPDGEVIDTSLVPTVLVSDNSRSFSENDVPLEDLILERALDLLRTPEEPEKQAA